MSPPSDHLLVEAAGSDTLVVYLSALNVGDGTFNWRRLGEAQGSHALFLSDKRNHWYLSGVAGIGSAADTANWVEQTARPLGREPHPLHRIEHGRLRRAVSRRSA